MGANGRDARGVEVWGEVNGPGKKEGDGGGGTTTFGEAMLWEWGVEGRRIETSFTTTSRQGTLPFTLGGQC